MATHWPAIGTSDRYWARLRGRLAAAPGQGRRPGLRGREPVLIQTAQCDVHRRLLDVDEHALGAQPDALGRRGRTARGSRRSGHLSEPERTSGADAVWARSAARSCGHDNSQRCVRPRRRAGARRRVGQRQCTISRLCGGARRQFAGSYASPVGRRAGWDRQLDQGRARSRGHGDQSDQGRPPAGSRGAVRACLLERGVDRRSVDGD